MCVGGVRACVCATSCDAIVCVPLCARVCVCAREQVRICGRGVFLGQASDRVRAECALLVHRHLEPVSFNPRCLIEDAPRSPPQQVFLRIAREAEEGSGSTDGSGYDDGGGEQSGKFR